MKKCMAASIFLFLVTNLSSQAQGLSQNGASATNPVMDISGRAKMTAAASPNIDGSPYYKEDFCIANLVINGKMFPSLEAKLNLQTSELIYKNAEGKDMVPVFPVEKVEFTGCGNTVFKTGFPAIDKQLSTTYYQVLNTGKVEALKYISFALHDVTPTGLSVSTYTQTLDREEAYYVNIPGKGIFKLTKTTDAVENILSDKKKEIDAYITSNRLKCKKDEDLGKIFTYYNSLK